MCIQVGLYSGCLGPLAGHRYADGPYIETKERLWLLRSSKSAVALPNGPGGEALAGFCAIPFRLKPPLPLGAGVGNSPDGLPRDIRSLWFEYTTGESGREGAIALFGTAKQAYVPGSGVAGAERMVVAGQGSLTSAGPAPGSGSAGPRCHHSRWWTAPRTRWQSAALRPEAGPG